MNNTGDSPRAPAWHTALLLLVTVVTFAPGLGAPFLWDDHQLIERNGLLHGPSWWRAALGKSFWDVPALLGAGMHPNTYYRPVVSLAYGVAWRLFHGAPWGFHLVSLCLHVACVLLVAGWLRRRVSGPHGPMAATMGALIFALHPGRPESVTWIAGSTDLWMSLGVLLALTAWDRGRGFFTAIGLVAAMFAKETAVAIPLALALDTLLLVPTGDERRRRFVRLAGVSAVITAVTLLRLQVFPPEAVHLLPAQVVPRVLTTLGSYARVLVWRWPASFQLGIVWYGPTLRPLVSLPAVLLGVALGLPIATLAIAAVFRPRARPWLADVGWFIAPLLPVLNIMDTRLRALAETHNLYLPVLGIAALVARAIGRCPATVRTPRLVALFAVPIAVFYAGQCIAREMDLRSEDHVFATEYAAEPRSPSAQREAYARALAAGDYGRARDVALRSYRMAIQGHIGEIVDFPSMVAEAQMNLCTDADQGCLFAIRDFARALPDPTVPARLAVGSFTFSVGPGQPWRCELFMRRHARIVLAVAEARTGDLAAAEATLRPVAVALPDAVPVWGTLALVLARQERFSEARGALDRARALSPGDPRLSEVTARLNRATALRRTAAVATDPIAAGAYRTQMFLALGAPVLARRAVTALETAYPGHPELSLLRAQVDASDRRYDLAREDLVAGRASDPEHAARWDAALNQLDAARASESTPGL